MAKLAKGNWKIEEEVSNRVDDSEKIFHFQRIKLLINVSLYIFFFIFLLVK